MPVHLLTFDLEHWYEGYRQRGLGGWADVPPRDPETVRRLLELLALRGQRATCFTTGRFAHEFPGLIREVATAGHEIASHGFEHIPINKMSSWAQFHDDVHHSIRTLEDLVGQPVTGFRAPKWSVSRKNREQVFDILGELGLTYDSSCFPRLLSGARSSGDLAPREVHHTLWEVPPTVLGIGPLRLRAAGGLYLRLLPEWLTRAALQRAGRSARPGLVYLHPYDLDTDCPRLPAPVPFKFGRYYALHRTYAILERLLQEFEFVPIRDWLARNAAPS